METPPEPQADPENRQKDSQNACWGSELESDASDEEPKADSGNGDAGFWMEDEETIDIHSVFLRDMLAERPLTTEVLEDHAPTSEATQKVVGGNIKTLLTGW